MSTMGDLDPTETTEWVDALAAVQQHRGAARTNFIVVSFGIPVPHRAMRPASS